MIPENVLVGSLILTGAVMGLVIHEATHFVVGLLTGTVRYVDLAFPMGRYAGYIPVAVLVGHSRRNWLSTLGPLVWLIPFYAFYVLPDAVPPELLLFGFLSFGVAGFTVFLSDIPIALGLLDYGDDTKYKRVRLVDYT